jgi:protocatechuate 3,4-dioxygenase, alpha subunit
MPKLDLVATPSQTAGPYLHLGLTAKRSVRCLADTKAKGERVWLTCCILDGDGTPVSDAMIEIWQANADGKYHHPEDTQQKAIDAAFGGFGRLATGEDGSCVFETVTPGRVPGNDGVLQAPHLNVSLFARGLLKRLATRIYFAGDPTNREDPVLSLVPQERRATLMAQPDPSRQGGWRFDIHLQGEGETVFFDI